MSIETNASLRELAARPNLEHLKKQARELLREGLAADAGAQARFAAFGIGGAEPKLADALHVIAREYGFENWPELKLKVEVGSEDGMAALAAAIRADDAGLVREVLRRHAGLKGRLDEPLPGYSFDQPAMVAAAGRDNREIAEALLDAGADVNVRTRWWAGGFGVLDMASPVLAEYLILRGATVDIHAACRLGKVERVRELLRKDAGLVHARGGDGQLPLHFAATVEIAALLLEHGAEMDVRDIDHESTAAQYMVGMRWFSVGQEGDSYRHEVVRFLMAQGAATDLLMASAVGDLGRVEAMLNDDPETIRMTVGERWFPKRDPRAGGHIYNFGFGFTKSPHMVAAQFGHTGVFELLMQRSPVWLRLINAAEVGDEALVERIVSGHPQLFAKLSEFAARRIIGAAVRNNTTAVALLLGKGWPAVAAMENGQTALHYAAWHGNAAMVRELVGHGAAVNVFETDHGGSPLTWALHGSLQSWAREKGDYPAVARALLAAGAELPKPEQMPLVGAEDVLAVVEGWVKPVEAGS